MLVTPSSGRRNKNFLRVFNIVKVQTPKEKATFVRVRKYVRLEVMSREIGLILSLVYIRHIYQLAVYYALKTIKRKILAKKKSFITERSVKLWKGLLFASQQLY